MRRLILLALAACGSPTPTPPADPQTVTVTVNADGTFTPAELDLWTGDTVEWVFAARTDTVIAGDGCESPAAFDPTSLTGPLPRAASGLFVLGPDGPGFTEDPNCPADFTVLTVGSRKLCRNGPPFATMESTLADPDVSGVFIRIRWNEVHLGPDQFDFSSLDREIAKAVRQGKVYNVGFKAGAEGTPDWIFDAGVAAYEFRDTGSGPECDVPPCCGPRMTLGSPLDPTYQTHYFALLQAAADHINARADFARALAYVKPSGANLFSHENRLPDGCTCGCDACNPEVWAASGYTPEGLYDFYRKQEALLAGLFPGKTMIYALIQAGFPKVTSATVYETCPADPDADLPRGTEQTETIIMQGQANHGIDFAVMHNGLGPFHEPNRWAVRAGEAGSVTGFQTQNPGEISTPADLEQTLTNLVDNTAGVFLEIYEQVLWRTAAEGVDLAPWAEVLHARRRDDWVSRGLVDPYPLRHRHTFDTAGSFPYFHGSRCTQAVIRVAQR